MSTAYADILRSLHPDIHATENGSVFFKWTNSVGQVIQDLVDSFEDIRDNLFVVSAVWRLTYWEELLGLGTNGTLTTQQRRDRIIAKMTAVGITVDAMKQVGRTFIGTDPVVIEWFSRGFRADVSRAGDPCIEEDDMFLFEVVVPDSVDPSSYNHEDFDAALEEHKPAHTELITTHPGDFTLSLTSANPQNIVRTTTTTYGLSITSTRTGRLNFTAKVSSPAGYEYAISTFSPVSQSFDALAGSGSFSWTAPDVSVATPYVLTVEAWGENGGYQSRTYTGTITLS